VRLDRDLLTQGDTPKTPRGGLVDRLDNYFIAYLQQDQCLSVDLANAAEACGELLTKIVSTMFRYIEAIAPLLFSLKDVLFHSSFCWRQSGHFF
jgi:hypothetical protein